MNGEPIVKRWRVRESELADDTYFVIAADDDSTIVALAWGLPAANHIVDLHNDWRLPVRSRHRSTKPWHERFRLRYMRRVVCPIFGHNWKEYVTTEACRRCGRVRLKEEYQ